jgi:predicted PhzF superfamily epimerase YddE/YHI9
MLASADAVLALQPARSHRRRIDIGVVGPHAPGGPADFELRAFFSDQHGAIIEDPVTGSLNASVAQWLFDTGRASGRYVAAQGTRLGRLGRVWLEQEPGGQVWVGGVARVLIGGAVEV